MIIKPPLHDVLSSHHSSLPPLVDCWVPPSPTPIVAIIIISHRSAAHHVVVHCHRPHCAVARRIVAIVVVACCAVTIVVAAHRAVAIIVVGCCQRVSGPTPTQAELSKRRSPPCRRHCWQARSASRRTGKCAWHRTA